jgi:hypothetical protein
MIQKLKIFLFLILAFVLKSEAQNAPFQIALEPMTISNLGGLQSFAWGQHDGKWLIVGGRLDGLHRRQPFASFDVAGNNTQLIVVDPIAKKKWSASLSSLPTAIQEQLSSTNMEFFQEGDYLYLAGGYGYSATSADHITYPNLSAVKVPEVIEAIMEGKSISSFFRQLNDTMFAITGGYINKIEDTYYLTGGQRFIGRYNPMGPDHGPGFTQNYSNSSRKFTIQDDGTTLKVTHQAPIIDAANLHRRDYNVANQILPNGEQGITAFSGVFQVSLDLPYLNSVNIDSKGLSVNTGFSQYYNHYHCAHVPLYSEKKNEMHTVFFGGIAQFYDSMGIMVQNNDVPFVKTIARVTRDSKGVMKEYKLPIEMPALLGAGSEFIPLKDNPQYDNEVIKLDEFKKDTTLIGYIYGGIASTAKNIFFINTGTESSASNTIFKVYLINNSTASVHNLNSQSIGSLQMRVYPNPNNGFFMIKFNLKSTDNVKLTITDVNGKTIESGILEDLEVGENTYTRKYRKLSKGGVYFITLETPYEKAVRKLVVEL